MIRHIRDASLDPTEIELAIAVDRINVNNIGWWPFHRLPICRRAPRHRPVLAMRPDPSVLNQKFVLACF